MRALTSDELKSIYNHERAIQLHISHMTSSTDKHTIQESFMSIIKHSVEILNITSIRR